jgi:hypothetical protein
MELRRSSGNINHITLPQNIAFSIVFYQSSLSYILWTRPTKTKPLRMLPTMTLRLHSLSKLLNYPATYRAFSSALAAKGVEGKKYNGEHVLDRKDEKDVQSSASHSGIRKRQEEDQNHSTAMSERDIGGLSEKAKKEHPEAPDPIIGMNDERGKVRLNS